MTFRNSAALLLLAFAGSAQAVVLTHPTMDTAELAAALRPQGLTITGVTIRNGQPGQFGTYGSFNAPPVTIRNGIVLSSGDVSNLGPCPEASDPGYDPASPPPQVNTQMTPGDETGGTPEFDAYGNIPGNIENFQGSFDVASLEVRFTLDDSYQVQFDFIFGSVEFPFYTSSFTDAFLVFLDGTDPTNQITFDSSGSAVQVGVSFAGLETSADVNTAFSQPHALIHHLTTTTEELDRGEHVLIFQVGDVNDHILDSAVFISHLRAIATSGNPGTDPSDDDSHCGADFNEDGNVDPDDLGDFINIFFGPEQEHDADFNGDGNIDPDDLGDFINVFFNPC